MQKNECMTYIQWSMVRNVINLDNEIAYKLRQVITKLKLNIIGYNKSIKVVIFIIGSFIASPSTPV